MAALFTDRQFFNCQTCTARLQKLNGCFEDLPEGTFLNVRFGEFQFRRCPRSQFGPIADYVAGLARMGTIRKGSPLELVKLPAKLFAALQYAEGELVKEKQ